MATTRSTRRTRHPGDSISRIMEAARAEFGEKGVETGTIEGVASRAGTSPQLIYHYYGNKHSLYEALLDQVGDEVHDLLWRKGHGRGSVVEDIEALVAAQFDLWPAFKRSFISDQINNAGSFITPDSRMAKGGARTVAMVETLLERGKREGVVRPDADARTFFYTCFLTISGFFASRTMMSRYLGRDYESPEAAAAWKIYATGMLLRSVLVAPTRDA